MELVTIEETRVFNLTPLHRPTGQLYLPEAIAKAIAKYGFLKVPTREEMANVTDHVAFGMGKFDDTQIQELRIYGDGIVAEARSNSRILDAFIEEFMEWLEAELKIVPTVTPKPERYYESTIVVRSKKNLATAIDIPSQIMEALNDHLEKMSYKARPYQPVGFLLDCDFTVPGGRRKPSRFSVDRRLGVPFEDNVFFSQAPLPTDDHFALLELVERLAR
jgi:hypothetical protein